MKIIDFTREHIAEAAKLALANYEEECSHVPTLPHIDTVPDLSGFADNELGVTAIEGGKIVGILCCYNPFNNAFGIPGLRGVFSPMGGNAAILENRAKIYSAMYQAAGEKWVRAGAVSHTVCLYAHDKEVQEQFFRYGFGMRCVDAIRSMDKIIIPSSCEDYSFLELELANILDVLPLDNMLDMCFINSPFFMYREPYNEEIFMKNYKNTESIYFTAKYKEKVVAFIRAELDGETFIKETPGYLHVKGAFCLPEHRGKGIIQHLLNMLIKKLKTQGYNRLGVDFESFNPSGSGFWLKHFTAYTHSVVRRIDENILKMDNK